MDRYERYMLYGMNLLVTGVILIFPTCLFAFLAIPAVVLILSGFGFILAAFWIDVKDDLKSLFKGLKIILNK